MHFSDVYFRHFLRPFSRPRVSATGHERHRADAGRQARGGGQEARARHERGIGHQIMTWTIC